MWKLQNCKYKLQVRDASGQGNPLWVEGADSKAELVAAFKAKFSNWRDLWAAIFDKRNVLNVTIKQPGKVRFVQA